MSLLKTSTALSSTATPPADSGDANVVENHLAEQNQTGESPGDQLAQTLTDNIQGSTASVSPEIQTRLKTLFPDMRADGDNAEEQPKEPLAAFRHKQVKLFQVDKFTFFDSILYIYSMEDLELFADLYKGLSGQDRVNIVSYDWKAAAAVESDAGAAIRGMLTSRSLKDPKAIK